MAAPAARPRRPASAADLSRCVACRTDRLQRRGRGRDATCHPRASGPAGRGRQDHSRVAFDGGCTGRSGESTRLQGTPLLLGRRLPSPQRPSRARALGWPRPSATPTLRTTGQRSVGPCRLARAHGVSPGAPRHRSLAGLSGRSSIGDRGTSGSGRPCCRTARRGRQATQLRDRGRSRSAGGGGGAFGRAKARFLNRAHTGHQPSTADAHKGERPPGRPLCHTATADGRSFRKTTLPTVVGRSAARGCCLSRRRPATIDLQVVALRPWSFHRRPGPAPRVRPSYMGPVPHVGPALSAHLPFRHHSGSRIWRPVSLQQAVGWQARSQGSMGFLSFVAEGGGWAWPNNCTVVLAPGRCSLRQAGSPPNRPVGQCLIRWQPVLIPGSTPTS